jgi:hypothetical protein
MNRRWSQLFAAFLLVALMMAAAPLSAQDSTERDPEELARRLLGFNDEAAIPEPFPVYGVGDTALFWVSKANQTEPSQITAQVAAAAPGVYIWVEEGLDFNAEALAQTAAQLDGIFTLLRLADNQAGISVVPQSAAELALLRQLRLPDVDNDPHFYILFARDLSTSRNAFFNPANSIPTQWVNGGFTNQHEMLMVNTSAAPGLALDDPAYVSILAREYIKLLTFYNNPGQAAWLREALTWALLFEVEQRELTADDVRLFLQAPETSLIRVNSGAEISAGQMFLQYVRQRFGEPAMRELLAQPGAGISALDRVLQARGLTDLVTGSAISARDVFADFALTNVLNFALGDGRYAYTGLAAVDGLNAAASLVSDQFDFQLPDLTINQFGTAYLGLATTDGVDFTLVFQGAETTPRMPIPGPVDNHFYWSGNGINQNTALYRAFDLSGVSSATLTFDAWYMLVDGWNYGYVSASVDGGQTWTLLRPTTASANNVYGLAYGPGLSGISSTEPPRPFPFLGIGLEADGITIASIREDSPLVGTTVQVGDTIAGFDEQVWQGQPDLIGFLSNFNPGDVVNLYILRGEEFFSVEVTLAAHPTRRFVPDPVWVTQTIDLSAFAGQTVIVRFDTVSASDVTDRGLAIDHIAIPEIGYLDDAEAGVQGWTLNGWQQITNQVAQRFLLQFAVLDTTTISNSRVGQLISPSSALTSGAWDFSLKPGEILLLAISGLSDNTDYPARYGLAASTGAGAEPTTAPGQST